MIIEVETIIGDIYNFPIDTIEYLSSTIKDEEDTTYNKYKSNRESPIYRQMEVYTIATTELSLEVSRSEYNRILNMWKTHESIH